MSPASNAEPVEGYPADFGRFPRRLRPTEPKGKLPSIKLAAQSATRPRGDEIARSRAGSPTRATRFSQSYRDKLNSDPALS